MKMRLSTVAEKLRRSERGGAAVELAVVVPFLLLLVAGVVDYGRAYYTATTVANAARAGAEYGARDPAFTNDTAAMNAFAQADGQEAGTISFTTKRYCECAGGVPQNSCGMCTGVVAPFVFIEVSASKNVSMFLAFPGLPSTLQIVRKATFQSQ